MSKMERNVRLFYIYIFFIRLDLWFSIIQLFFLDRGFSLTQYTLAGSVWYLANLLSEIPTGAITDRLGKRISMLISLVSLSLSLFILAFGQTIYHALLSYVIWGFSSSFETGTYSAFLYDSLKEEDREEDFRRVIGRVRAVTITAAAVGSLSAGYLGGIGLDLPILFNAAIPILLCPFLLLFTEPEVSGASEPSYALHITESVRYVSQHKRVAWIILYSSLMSAAVWGLYNFYQPFLYALGVTVEGIGILYSLFRLTSAAGAYLSDSLYNVIGQTSIYLVPFCLAVSVLCIGAFQTPWIAGLLFVNFFISGFYVPILSDLFNKNLPPRKRATIISLSAVLSSLLNATIDPVLGKIADTFSIQATFWTVGIGLFISMGFIIVMLRNGLRKDLAVV
jgi:MFS family permease